MNLGKGFSSLLLTTLTCSTRQEDVLSTPGDDKEEEVQEILVVKLKDRESLAKSREAYVQDILNGLRCTVPICMGGDSSKIHGRKHIM
jgi:hypothetical protein